MKSISNTPFALGLSATLLLSTFGCQPNTTPNDTQPSPSASASTTPTPDMTPTSTAEPTPTPAPSTTPEPTPKPTATPVATPEPTATPTPTPSATPEPTPEPTPTPNPMARLEVKVFDDNSSPLNNAIVEVVSLSPESDFSAKATLDNTAYVVDVPRNISLEVKATAPGYTTRTRFTSAVLGEEKIALEFKDQNAISDKPEVVLTQPKRSGSLKYNEPIILTFSENMNKKSVEDSFAIQSDAPDVSEFLVGTPIPRALSLTARPSDTILDIKHFNIEWDTDRVLKLTPRYGYPFANTNRFRISLTHINSDGNGGGIKDSGGTRALTPVQNQITDEDGVQNVEDGPFLSGTSHKPYLPFTVSSEKPSPVSFTGVASEVSNSDNVVLSFSGPLKFTLATGEVVVGGADGSTGNAPAEHSKVTALQAGKNYNITCNGTPVAMPASTKATFLADNKVKVFVDPADNLFNTGDQCSITIAGIVDYTGQIVTSGSRSFIAP